jgi:hypothetical protein
VKQFTCACQNLQSHVKIAHSCKPNHMTLAECSTNLLIKKKNVCEQITSHCQISSLAM